MAFFIIAIKFVFVPDSPRSWNRSSFHVHTLPHQGTTSLLRLFDNFSFDLPSQSAGPFYGTPPGKALLGPRTVPLEVFIFLANFGS